MHAPAESTAAQPDREPFTGSLSPSEHASLVGQMLVMLIHQTTDVPALIARLRNTSGSTEFMQRQSAWLAGELQRIYDASPRMAGFHARADARDRAAAAVPVATPDAYEIVRAKGLRLGQDVLVAAGAAGSHRVKVSTATVVGAVGDALLVDGGAVRAVRRAEHCVTSAADGFAALAVGEFGGEVEDGSLPAGWVIYDAQGKRLGALVQFGSFLDGGADVYAQAVLPVNAAGAVDCWKSHTAAASCWEANTAALVGAEVAS